MNSKQREAIRRDLVEGSPALQRQAVNEHKPRLQQDLLRLQEEAGQQKAEFKAYLQAWAGRHVEGLPRPTALPQDVRKARLALLGAWLLAAGLAQVIESLRAVHFAAYQFGDNGWEARELAARDFPALEQARSGEKHVIPVSAGSVRVKRIRLNRMLPAEAGTTCC